MGDEACSANNKRHSRTTIYTKDVSVQYAGQAVTVEGWGGGQEPMELSDTNED
jgi:hypothetical protein